MSRQAIILLAALGLTGALLAAFVLMRPVPPQPTPAATGDAAAVRTAPAETPRESAAGERAPRPAARPSVASPPPAAPTRATLRIVSDVPGAQVFVDRQFKGTTPLVVEDVAPGSHRVNVSADGFDGLAETIEVEAGAHEISFRFREVRLDAHVDVVHRHGIGSCRGRLSATPAGLRYDSEDDGHRFRAELLDLETFEVDYLANALRIRVHGDTFNFSDPEGNADRLFVFHRDVDRARERLRRGDTAAVE